MSVRVVALLVLAALAGCSAPDPAPPQPPPTSTTAKAPADSGLRPVTVPYRDGLAYVPEETAAQALCHALTPGEWADLLGGDAGRTIRFDGSTACVAVSGGLTITARMTGGSIAGTSGGPEDVAGHHAWFTEDETSASAAAEVGPHDARDPALPVLRLSASTTHPQELDDLLRRLLTMLLTRLAHDGPATPAEDAYGRVPATPTPPVEGVRLFDLPRPVQGLVLCAAMANTAPAGYRADRFGQCVADDNSRRALVTQGSTDNGPAQFTVGGRPARFGPAGTLYVDLAELPAGVTASDGVQHVQLALTWSGADQAATREWAERFAGQLGDL